MTAPAATAPAGGPARPLLTELRRGTGPAAGLALVLVLAPALISKADQWQGSWGETQSLLRSAATLLGGPLAVAAGCWQGGRERRRGLDELRSAAGRGALAQLLVSALPVAVWVAGGYLLVAAGAVAATWPYATAGGPRPEAVVADTAFLAAMTLIGHVAGRLAPWRAAAPVLAGCAYAVLIAPVYGSNSPARFLTPVGTASGDISAPVWWQPLTASVWTGGLAVAAVLACAARRRLTALLPLALSAAAAGVLIQAGDGMWREQPLADRQVCDTSVRPQICVSALDPGLLPEVRNALTGLHGRLHGVGNLPARFEDRGGAPGPDEVELPMLRPIGWGVVRGRLTDPGQYAWEAAAALALRHENCGGAPRHSPVDSVVTDWLAGDPGRAATERRALEQASERGDRERAAAITAERAARARLDRMPGDERRAWLTDYFATVESCDPKDVPTL
ncbi:hypothetical protein [Streptomyces zhihengii]